MNYYPSLTNKNIEFLSDQKLIGILMSVLDEIDVAASSGAHRSTTYLAVSAIEGLFGEILKLKRLLPEANTVPKGWPVNKKTGQPKAFADLKLEEREKVLQENNALPSNFERLYEPIRVFRNYMHPERELKNQTPIAQSVAQLALAALNALIEKYESQRFAAMQEWQLEYGLAKVLADDVIYMPQQPGANPNASLLVSAQNAEQFREIAFRVNVPRDAIFDFVYSYHSKDQFMAARIGGREHTNGRGLDNGRLHCIKWGNWPVNGRYTLDTEPSPRQREHTVRVVLNPPEDFALTVNGVQLRLEDDIGWVFDPQGKIGFITECGIVSILDLYVIAQ